MPRRTRPDKLLDRKTSSSESDHGRNCLGPLETHVHLGQDTQKWPFAPIFGPPKVDLRLYFGKLVASSYGPSAIEPAASSGRTNTGGFEIIRVGAGWFVPASGTIASTTFGFMARSGLAGTNHPAATSGVVWGSYRRDGRSPPPILGSLRGLGSRVRAIPRLYKSGGRYAKASALDGPVNSQAVGATGPGLLR